MPKITCYYLGLLKKASRDSAAIAGYGACACRERC